MVSRDYPLSMLKVLSVVFLLFFFYMAFALSATSSNLSLARGIFLSDVLMRIHSKTFYWLLLNLDKIQKILENKPRKEPLNAGGVRIPWHGENIAH